MASCEITPIFRGGNCVGEKVRRRSRKGQIYNDAMAILLHVVNNPQEYQTYASLARGTGIPVTTLKRIILWHVDNGKENCVLHYVAIKAGVIFKYVGKPGEILFARYADEAERKALAGPIY